MPEGALPPAERRGVHRKMVSTVVEHMLQLDRGVKWIAITYEDTIGTVDRFHIVPYTVHPSEAPPG